MADERPLVAPRVEAPAGAWSGVWIAEDIALIRASVKNGDWIDGALGVVGAGLDGLALVVDPAGVLLQYGIAWTIEYVKPLSEALDWLAGDAAQIAANAATWRAIAAELSRQDEALDRAVRFDLSEWEGRAADAYRGWAHEQHHAIDALAGAAGTMAEIIEGAGSLIAAVRLMVRDAIAVVVSRLVVYAVEEAATLGLATPLVLEQAGTLVASWGARIAGWLRGLLASLRNLLPVVRRLGSLMDELKHVLSRLRARSEDAAALQRVRRRGAGPIQLFNLESVHSIAAKYGLDIAGLDIALGSKTTRGICGRTYPDGRIVLFPTGFRSEEDLARTIAHERFHHDELASGKPFPMTAKEVDEFEDRAYDHEDVWWDNQPVRPE